MRIPGSPHSLHQSMVHMLTPHTLPIKGGQADVQGARTADRLVDRQLGGADHGAQGTSPVGHRIMALLVPTTTTTTARQA
eukprot:scaffold2849_cov63-Phaeocystis_antarctica.AAC.2